MSGFYDDIVFPTSISLRAFSGKKSFQTTIKALGSGREQRIAYWDESLRSYEAGLVVRPATDYQLIQALHEVAYGAAYGFLLADATDNDPNVGGTGLLAPQDANGLAIGTNGSGYGVPSVRTTKRYTFQTRSRDRIVRKPSSAVVKRNGTTVTVGTLAGNIAIDATTGLVTFVPDASTTISAVTVGSTTSVTVSAALAGLTVGGRLYLQGLAGADAALLNNQSHAIASIASNVYTLSTNTDGKTITPAGSAFKFPQPTDTLTWTGGFYVPVRFDSDDLEWETIDKQPSGDLLIGGPSIKLVEIRT